MTLLKAWSKTSLKTLLLASLATGFIHTASAAEMQMPAPAPMPAQARADMTEGEVRKIDLGAGKITLKHGDIKNMDMPGMTMVFRVKTPAMLETLKVGDKVAFKVEKSDSAMIVTEIERAK